MIKIFLFFTFFFIFIPATLFAQELSGIGMVAGNMTGPIEMVSGFVETGCFIVGVACVFASILKYFEHRRSPLAVPLSKVLWLMFIGFSLMCLPFSYLITGYGVPFSVLWSNNGS